MVEAEPNLAQRDRTLLERLYAFQACHKVKAGPLQQYDGFDLLITYLRGHTETNDLRELCRLIHQLRLIGVTIGTSLHNVRDSWYCVVPCADYNGCPFADCTKCKNHLNPDEFAPDMEWLFQTESRLVHQLIKQIKFEPIRHAQSHHTRADRTPDGRTRSLTRPVRRDGFVDRVCRNENNLSHRPAKRPHYYTSNLFKVTIDDGVITDIWHRDDTIGSTRIISPHFDLDVTYRNCLTIWFDFNQQPGTDIFIPVRH